MQTEALPPANDFLFYESLKSPAAGATLEVFGLSLKEHCFHQFESNLKPRHYEYAFSIFKDISFIHVFQCCHFSFLYLTFFPKRHYFSFFENNDYLYKFILFHFYFIFSFLLFFCFFSIIFLKLFSLIPRKFLKFKASP